MSAMAIGSFKVRRVFIDGEQLHEIASATVTYTPKGVTLTLEMAVYDVQVDAVGNINAITIPAANKSQT